MPLKNNSSTGEALLIRMKKIMQWSKGALIGVAPRTCVCVGTEKGRCLELSMAGSEDEWKLLCVERATTFTKTCGIRIWRMSSRRSIRDAILTTSSYTIAILATWVLPQVA